MNLYWQMFYAIGQTCIDRHCRILKKYSSHLGTLSTCHLAFYNPNFLSLFLSFILSLSLSLTLTIVPSHFIFTQKASTRSLKICWVMLYNDLINFNVDSCWLKYFNSALSPLFKRSIYCRQICLMKFATYGRVFRYLLHTFSWIR